MHISQLERGKKNQLAYYSNYGPRVDIAAPGGARKFNLYRYDGGGTPGFPVTNTEGYKSWETFGITSNWALQIPCYFNVGTEFYQNECYSNIQGTSMACPHVAAVAALIVNGNPRARKNVTELVRILKGSAQRIAGNVMPPFSATDTSPADLPGDTTCSTTAMCHLGGNPISDREAYGAGLVDAFASQSAMWKL